MLFVLLDGLVLSICLLLVALYCLFCNCYKSVVLGMNFGDSCFSCCELFNLRMVVGLCSCFSWLFGVGACLY